MMTIEELQDLFAKINGSYDRMEAMMSEWLSRMDSMIQEYGIVERPRNTKFEETKSSIGMKDCHLFDEIPQSDSMGFQHNVCMNACQLFDEIPHSNSMGFQHESYKFGVREMYPKASESVTNGDKSSHKRMEEFTEIMQTGTVDEYQQRFEELQAMVMPGLPQMQESYYIDVFISGLKKEIKSMVKLVGPKTLIQAMQTAKLQEKTVNALQKFQNRNYSRNSHYPSSLTYPYQKASTKLANTKPWTNSTQSTDHQSPLPKESSTPAEKSENEGGLDEVDDDNEEEHGHESEVIEEKEPMIENVVVVAPKKSTICKSFYLANIYGLSSPILSRIADIMDSSTKEVRKLDESANETNNKKALKEKFKGLCKVIEDVIGDKFEKVVLTDRVLDSSYCLVTREYGWMTNIERGVNLVLQLLCKRKMVRGIGYVIEERDKSGLHTDTPSVPVILKYVHYIVEFVTKNFVWDPGILDCR